LNTYKNLFFIFGCWLLPENLTFALKITVLPDSGAAAPCLVRLWSFRPKMFNYFMTVLFICLLGFYIQTESSHCTVNN